ncbi:hypothetical protein E2C01_035226 [Portunus trituberculatus]|uniref:Uncharacterized protein n=1 Tax=Portunus trituberculatus TaxID=210409 RepID=A0A5B7F8M9_PORTR|nr:hypothetical protein [Portunus trituberculatus]
MSAPLHPSFAPWSKRHRQVATGRISSSCTRCDTRLRKSLRTRFPAAGSTLDTHAAGPLGTAHHTLSKSTFNTS